MAEKKGKPGRRSRQRPRWRRRLSDQGAARRNVIRRSVAERTHQRRNLFDWIIDSTDSILESISSIEKTLKKTDRREKETERRRKAALRNRKIGTDILKGLKGLAGSSIAPLVLAGGILDGFNEKEIQGALPRTTATGKVSASSALDANVEGGRNEKSRGKKASGLTELFNLGLANSKDLKGVASLAEMNKASLTAVAESHESRSIPAIIDRMDVSDLSTNEDNWRLLANLKNERDYARLLNLSPSVRNKTFKLMLLEATRRATEASTGVSKKDARISDIAAGRAIQQANAHGKADFKYALANLMASEGGYHPNLDGANVYKGIDRGKGRAGASWRGWKRFDELREQYKAEHPGESDFPINAIIDDPELDKMVADFYKANFWDANQLDMAPNNILASLAFDFLVNSGNDKTVRNAAAQFGLAGGSTGQLLASIPMYKWDEFADALLDQRLTDYSKMRNWDKYQNAWTRRVAELRGMIPQDVKASNGVLLASGAMVEAIAGEAGPELVLPMNERGGRVLADAVKRVFEDATLKSDKTAKEKRIARMRGFFENEFLPELKRRFSE